jgi:hypothetical protein
VLKVQQHTIVTAPAIVRVLVIVHLLIVLVLVIVLAHLLIVLVLVTAPVIVIAADNLLLTKDLI